MSTSLSSKSSTKTVIEMRYTESIPDFRFLEESIQWVGQKLVSPEFMVALSFRKFEAHSSDIWIRTFALFFFFDLEHISFVCLYDLSELSLSLYLVF